MRRQERIRNGEERQMAGEENRDTPRAIAAALNAIQETHDLNNSVLVALVLSDLASRLPLSRERLHPAMQRVLEENRWNLYAR